MLNETWSLSDLPPGRTCIKSRWIFKIKPGAHGSDNRYKARLVAKGFSRRPGIDFEETFSPVIKHDTLRVVLSLVAAHDLEMSQLDVKTAFLYGELDEEIYLQQPEGYVVAGKEGSICRLRKCIYGLNRLRAYGIGISITSSENLGCDQVRLIHVSTSARKKLNLLSSSYGWTTAWCAVTMRASSQISLSIYASILT